MSAGGTGAGGIAGAPMKMGQLMKRPSMPKDKVGKKKSKRFGIPESGDDMTCCGCDKVYTAKDCTDGDTSTCPSCGCEQ